LRRLHSRWPTPGTNHVERHRTPAIRGRFDADAHVGSALKRALPRGSRVGKIVRRPLRIGWLERLYRQAGRVEELTPLRCGGRGDVGVELRRDGVKLEEA